MNRFYVYAHYKADVNEIFYIGKGSTIRAWIGSSRRNALWKNVANKHGYRIEILHTDLDEVTAFDLEANYIQCFGRRDIGTGCLVNMTDGYEGQSGAVISKRTRALLSERSKGHVVSEETKLKISLSQKGKYVSEDTRKKISKSKKGQMSWNKGKHLSEEHKDKIRQSMLRGN